MKKKLLVLFVVLLLSFTMFACANEEANAPEVSDDQPSNFNLILPTIEDDYWEVFDYNCDIVFEPDFSYMLGVDLTLLSATPLEQGDVTVTTVSGSDMNPYLFAYDNDKGIYAMYEDIFLLYQGVSIEELISYQERSDDMSVERQTEIYDLVKAFRELDENEKPMIYRYKLDLSFPDTFINNNGALDEVLITVNGETRTYDFGKVINQMYEKSEYISDPNFSLNCDDNIGSYGQNVGISSDGTARINNIKYNAVEDVTITGLSFYKADEVKIKSVSITETTADGATIDTAWDTKKPIKLSAGESIILNLEIADPFFANTLGGWDIRYLVIEYQCKGNTYEQPITFQCHQTLDDPFAYIAMEDGIDILSFYTDYINRNRAY